MDAREKVRRFGWVQPDVESGDGRIVIGVSEKDFSEEEWEEFGEIVGAIAEFRPYVADFLALESSYRAVRDLETKILSEIDTRALASFFGGVELLKAHSIVDQAISNFLTAASAFRDRAIARAGGTPNCESRIEQMKESFSSCYDSSFAYRLLYNLRNYGQHHAAPIDSIPIAGKRNQATEMIASVRFEIRREALLRSKRIQPKVRKELEQNSEAILLIPLATGYMKCHGRIMLGMIDARRDAFSRFAAYAKAVYLRKKLPKNATPVIWEGPKIENVWPDLRTDMHGFSFDEFALLTKLMIRLRAGLDLGECTDGSCPPK
jgi:hypothetical protein